MRLGSFECALGVVGFVHVLSVHSAVGRRVHLGSLGGCRLIDSGAPCVSPGSIGRALGVAEFIPMHCVPLAAPLVSSGSLGSFRRALCVVRFRLCHSRAHCKSSRLFGRALRFVGFIRARVVVVGFILVRWVHPRALWMSSG